MNFVSRTEIPAGPAILVLLPDRPPSDSFAACWWRIADGRVQATGDDVSWVDESAHSGVSLIALAPTSALRFHFIDRPEDAVDRQAKAAARIEALRQSASPAEIIHTATATLTGRPGRLITALVDRGRMRDWLDWLGMVSRDPDHIVPAAMAVTMGDEPVRAVIGTDTVVARDGLLVVDDPVLTDLLFEPGTEPVPVGKGAVRDGLVRVASDPVPDLRTGPFARRRVLIESRVAKQLALIALAVILVTTMAALVEIVRLNYASDRLDAEALALAQAVSGNGVSLETAEQVVAARAGSASGFGVPLAALLARLQEEQAVAATSLAYSSGTLSVTLAGPDRQSIDRVLLDLQREGYGVSAVPRERSDGRKMADITIRIIK